MLTNGLRPETVCALLADRASRGLTVVTTLTNGDRVRVKLVRADFVRVGDVLADNWDGDLAAVRVEEVEELGDDVEMTLDRGAMSTSVGNLVALVAG